MKEYDEGMQAYWAGVDTCPYRAGTKSAIKWWAGWEDAEEEERGEPNYALDVSAIA